MSGLKRSEKPTQRSMRCDCGFRRSQNRQLMRGGRA